MRPHGTGTDNPIDFPQEVELDSRENVELRLEREELFNLMLLAHQRDITLNQLVEDILRVQIETEYHRGVDG